MDRQSFVAAIISIAHLPPLPSPPPVVNRTYLPVASRLAVVVSERARKRLGVEEKENSM